MPLESVTGRKQNCRQSWDHLLDDSLPNHHQGRHHHHEFMTAESWLSIRLASGRLTHDNQTNERLKWVNKIVELFQFTMDLSILIRRMLLFSMKMLPCHPLTTREANQKLLLTYLELQEKETVLRNIPSKPERGLRNHPCFTVQKPSFQ